MTHKYESFNEILISRNEIDFDGGDFIGIGRIQAKAKNDKGESFKTTWQFKLNPLLANPGKFIQKIFPYIIFWS